MQGAESMEYGPCQCLYSEAVREGLAEASRYATSGSAKDAGRASSRVKAAVTQVQLHLLKTAGSEYGTLAGIPTIYHVSSKGPILGTMDTWSETTSASSRTAQVLLRTGGLELPWTSKWGFPEVGGPRNGPPYIYIYTSTYSFICFL